MMSADYESIVDSDQSDRNIFLELRWGYCHKNLENHLKNFPLWRHPTAKKIPKPRMRRALIPGSI